MIHMRHLTRRTFLTAATASLAAVPLAGRAFAAQSDTATRGARYEVVARLCGAMPTGVTVSHHGRVFVCFPRWSEDVPFTVAELRDIAMP